MDLPLDRDPTATVESDFSLSSRRIWSIGFQSDGIGDAWKNSTIAAQLNRDRGAIEPRSLHLQHGIKVASLLIDLTGVVKASMPRSTPDRGLIKAKNVARLWWFWKPNWSWVIVEFKPLAMPMESHPRRWETASTTAPITHDLRTNSLFKYPCTSPFLL